MYLYVLLFKRNSIDDDFKEEIMEEEIEQNDKHKKSKYKLICIFFICIEILLLGYMSIIFVCNCGHPFYNTIISKVVVTIQIIFNLVLDKPFISKSKSKYLLLVINIVLIVIFFIGLKLIPNDMDKLHSLMFVKT